MSHHSISRASSVVLVAASACWALSSSTSRAQNETEPPADPKEAPHRAMGIAVGPDGALYVSDDVKGRIWRIAYVGGGPASE